MRKVLLSGENLRLILLSWRYQCIDEVKYKLCSIIRYQCIDEVKYKLCSIIGHLHYTHLHLNSSKFTTCRNLTKSTSRPNLVPGGVYVPDYTIVHADFPFTAWNFVIQVLSLL